jgi:hypothetical protein
MPFKLRKCPKKDLYWVVNKDTKQKYSKEPLPKERAEAQMKALYANVPDARGGGFVDDAMNTFNNVKKEFKDKGAAVLTGTNYVGPFNRLDDEYLKSHPPTDVIDEGAMKHDLEYSRIAKLRKAGTPKAEIERLIRVSDDAFLDNIRKNFKANPRASILGYAGIKSKNLAEDYAGLDKNLFVGEGLRGGFTSRTGYEITLLPDRQSLRVEKGHISIVVSPADNEVSFLDKYRQQRGRSSFRSLNFEFPNEDDLTAQLWSDIENIRESTRAARGIASHFSERGIVNNILDFKGAGIKGNAAKKRVKLLKKLHGSGFFGDLWDSGKRFVEKTVERVKQTGESIVNVFQGKAPRLDFPPAVRRMIEEYGNLPIVRMFVRRDPIQSALDTALNFISMGSWSSLKDKFGYDKFYHLQLMVIVRVSDSDDVNKPITIQKNEVIDISPSEPTTEKTEMVSVPISQGHTINSILGNAKQIMGENFYYYSAFHNNCQDFVSALLRGSGLMTPSLEAFVKQPVDELVKGIPITDRIARGITDLGGVFNVALEGKGGLQPRAVFAAQLKEAGVNPSVYLEKAKKNANASGLASNMLGFSSDDKHKLQIPNADGKIIRFGAVGLGDYILYKLQKDTDAEKHRKAYLARAMKIKGDWAKDPYSANSLAISCLWDGDR